MNWDQFEGKFKQFEGSIREKWGKLSKDDVDRICGQREQLVGRVQERYGCARQAAEKEADAWWRQVNESDASTSAGHP
jgi:uncharacterized protein YjbJ (UPF0337 family)